MTTSPPPPIFVQGRVVKGFGRGSKKLGCPTANLDMKDVGESVDSLSTGVYYGFASLIPNQEVYQMVCSLGYNPTFGNETKSLEVHILHSFPDDFYGSTLKAVIVGKIRDERKFDSLQDLMDAIEDDKDHARRRLSEEEDEGSPNYAILSRLKKQLMMMS